MTGSIEDSFPLSFCSLAPALCLSNFIEHTFSSSLLSSSILFLFLHRRSFFFRFPSDAATVREFCREIGARTALRQLSVDASRSLSDDYWWIPFIVDNDLRNNTTIQSLRFERWSLCRLCFFLSFLLLRMAKAKANAECDCLCVAVNSFEDSIATSLCSLIKWNSTLTRLEIFVSLWAS